MRISDWSSDVCSSDLQHFVAVAENAGLPIVLYNVPSRTGCDLLPETTARLHTHRAIIGIKEAVSAAERIRALLPLRRADFTVLSGDDPSCANAIARGADGVISVASNVVPEIGRASCRERVCPYV